MGREETKIKEAYRKSKNIYDDALTSNGLIYKVYNKLVWGMEDENYVSKLLQFIPKNFEGRLLDVPSGTAIFTFEKYATLSKAEIVALDYSQDMLEQAKRRFKCANINNVNCVQGDVGQLPFESDSFDLVLSMNGFHAFPEKEKAFEEIYRVLKHKGIFCGCFYIRGERCVTDFVVKKWLAMKGWFTSPFYTKDEIERKLKDYYSDVYIDNVKSIVFFKCIK